MYSVSETVENGKVCVTSHPDIWVKNEILLWPPKGSGIENHEIIAPGPDWTQYDCKVLRKNIETFEEALELEGMYSKHRDSNSFREHQTQKLSKRRQQPVNYAESSGELIDLNYMVRSIDAELAQKRDYHEDCTTGTHSKKAVAEASVKFVGASVKGKTTKELPYQKNFVKSGATHLEAKNRGVPNLIKPKLPRYDNFLKSGKRFDGVTSKVTPHAKVPSTTSEKEHHSKRVRGTGDDYDNEAPIPKKFASVSTPVEAQTKNRQENKITGSSAMLVPKANGRMFSNVNSGSLDGLTKKKRVAFLAQQSRKNSICSSLVTQVITLRMEMTTMKIPSAIQHHSRPNKSIIDYQALSIAFKNVLQELSNIKKGQESFETRIENKIATFIKDQSTNMHRKSSVQDNDQSHIRFQSRQHSRTQVRHRDVVPDRYVDDLDEYDELDEQFPLKVKHHVEELEYNIRKNLEFKFFLNSRLNELSGKTYKKSIRLKVSYLFTNPVQECYTWRGTEEKGAFKKFRAINNLILRSVRDRHPNTHKDEYKDYLMTWLKHAKSRQRKVTYSYPSRKDLNREDNSDSDDENF